MVSLSLVKFPTSAENRDKVYRLEPSGFEFFFRARVGFGFSGRVFGLPDPSLRDHGFFVFGEVSYVSRES
jgi:hypothetical protein